MVRLLLVGFVVATLAVRVAGQGPAAGKDEKQLAELQQTLATAWVGGDRATIERIIAPDWSSTGPDGRVADRAGVQ